MTKPQSTAAYVLRLTLTLFLITVIVAGLLAFVNYLTADTIAEHTAEAARSAMTQVLAADDYTELPVSDAPGRHRRDGRVERRGRRDRRPADDERLRRGH